MEILRVPAPVLCVTRFDRVRAGGQVYRRHVIDGCQALDLPVSAKCERPLGNGEDVRHIRDGASFQALSTLRPFDLALAQISALGATLAFAAGHDPSSIGGLAYTLFFSAVGAALLALTRSLPKSIDHEAYIGIIYIVSTAGTIIAVDQSPQGAEHVKQILIGSILGMSFEDLPRLSILYGTVGALLWFARKPIGDASRFTPSTNARAHMAWDFLFYFLFSLVVTSSVAIAGVLLVFCFLIIPSLIGSLFSQRPGILYMVGWLAGTVASAAGLSASYTWDLPTGAALVIAFAASLLIAGLLRSAALVPPQRWLASLRRCARTICAGILATVGIGNALAHRRAARRPTFACCSREGHWRRSGAIPDTRRATEVRSRDRNGQIEA